MISPLPLTVSPKLSARKTLYLDQADLELVAILILGLLTIPPNLALAFELKV